MRCSWLYAWSVLAATTSAQIFGGIPNSGRTEFYLDTARDCGGTPREVGQSTVEVYGKSTIPQGAPTTSCTLTLNTANEREPHRFKLEFAIMTIISPGVQFYVYDGEFDARLMYAFSNQNGLPSNLAFDFTTGQQVTFRLTRGTEDRDYNIHVVVIPVPSSIYNCETGNEMGCDEYNYKYRPLSTKDIIGIVGGVFALIVLIVIITVVCCYRKQRGVTQKWKEEKLGHVNTAASLHSLSGKVPKDTNPPQSKPWTSESSKNGFASIRRSPNLPRAKIARSSRMGDGALSDSNASLPLKRPLPPPQVNHNPRGASSKGRNRYRDRDRYSDHSSETSFNTDKNFSEKTFTSRGFSERTIGSSKNMVPPSYREVMRNNRTESESSADEHSFVRANDDHPQETFVEKVIVPRVKTKGSPKFQRAPPPPEEDMAYDSIDPKKLTRGQKKTADAGTQDNEDSEESDTENESEEEDSDEEEEESEEEEEEDPKKDEADAVYSKPNKSNDEKQQTGPQISQNQGAFRPPNPQHFQGAPGFLPPGVHHPQPRYGYPGQPQGPQTGAYPQYPLGQPPRGPPPSYPQGQPYPQPAPSSYHQANFTVPLQQQQQQPLPSRNRQSQKPREPAQQAGHIPVYSYLVNRGYQPMEGRHSPHSVSTGASNHSADHSLQNDDSDFSANLDSGVELMKRKN